MQCSRVIFYKGAKLAPGWCVTNAATLSRLYTVTLLSGYECTLLQSVNKLLAASAAQLNLCLKIVLLSRGDVQCTKDGQADLLWTLPVNLTLSSVRVQCTAGLG